MKCHGLMCFYLLSEIILYYLIFKAKTAVYLLNVVIYLYPSTISFILV